MPRSGKWYGLLNSTKAASDGTISRTVTIPNTSTAMLRFYMLISTSTRVGKHGHADRHRPGTVDIRIDGTLIPFGDGHWDQTFANNTYQRWDVPVDAWAGQTVTLVDHRTPGRPRPTGYFQVLLDDFSLTPR